MQPNDKCENVTVEVPEIRHEDPIFKRLIAQVWADYQYKLNQEGELYGFVVDPLEVDSKLSKPINDSYSGTGYQADVQMHDIMVSYCTANIYIYKIFAVSRVILGS